MSNYDVQQAKASLTSAKEEVQNYLHTHYPKDKEKMAGEAFKHLEDIVTKIIKRQKFDLAWGSGASPCWHASIFLMLSAWIEAEVSLSIAISDALK